MKQEFEVAISPLNSFDHYTYVVCFCKYQGGWLYCRANTRTSFETAGGKIEDGETLLEAAKRELFEEAGATDFEIKAAFDYSVRRKPTREFSHGCVFYVEIHELNGLFEFEMDEVKVFETIPDEMRFPQILPTLYENMIGWLNIEDAKNELWDIYDENRKHTGRTQKRSEALASGDYHIVAICIVQNKKGEYLIVKRGPLITFPGMWCFPGGSAITGHNSLSAAFKELIEETGLMPTTESASLLHTMRGANAFYDIWLFKHDFKLDDIVLQPGETVDAKLVTLNEYEELLQKNEAAQGAYLDGVLEKLK